MVFQRQGFGLLRKKKKKKKKKSFQVQLKTTLRDQLSYQEAHSKGQGFDKNTSISCFEACAISLNCVGPSAQIFCGMQRTTPGNLTN